ncbi:MAG: hypothetical protein ACRDP9_30585 [Kribbellaceae bacterium]
MRDQVERRLASAMAVKPAAGAAVAEVRQYVEASLGLQVWSHAVYRHLLANPHQHLGPHEHD